MIPDLYERKLAVEEILKASWKIYFRNFFYIFLFCFFAGCVLRGVDYLIYISLPHSPQDPALSGNCKTLFSGFFGFVCSLAILSIVNSEQKNQPVCWSSIFYTVRHFFWPAFFVHFLTQLISALTWMPGVLVRLNNISNGVSFFIELPLFFTSFILLIYFTFACEAVVLKGEYGASALACSFRTVKGRWWSVFGLILFLALLVGIPMMIFAFIVRKVGQVSIADGLYLLSPVAMVFSAYFSIFFAILFLNLTRNFSENRITKIDHSADPVNPV